jgi:hypothetical protein
VTWFSDVTWLSGEVLSAEPQGSNRSVPARAFLTMSRASASFDAHVVERHLACHVHYVSTCSCVVQLPRFSRSLRAAVRRRLDVGSGPAEVAPNEPRDLVLRATSGDRIECALSKPSRDAASL